jgi:hypothetical protein
MLSDDATPQQIFDYVLQFLWDQNALSKSGSACLYLGPNNTRCAVGCLMTTEEAEWADTIKSNWSPDLGVSVNALVENFGAPLRPFFKKNASLLLILQRIHDNIIEGLSFRAELTHRFRSSFNAYQHAYDLNDTLLKKLEAELKTS